MAAYDEEMCLVVVDLVVAVAAVAASGQSRSGLAPAAFNIIRIDLVYTNTKKEIYIKKCWFDTTNNVQTRL